MGASPEVKTDAQLLATLLAGGGAHAVTRPGTASRMLAEATKGATDSHIQQAADLMKTGQALPAGGADAALGQVGAASAASPA